MLEAIQPAEHQTVDWLALADQLFPAEALGAAGPTSGTRIAS